MVNVMSLIHDFVLQNLSTIATATKNMVNVMSSHERPLIHDFFLLNLSTKATVTKKHSRVTSPQCRIFHLVLKYFKKLY